ncbi:MAG: class I SAM-dependent methyltransferase [Deltaproteobacteria bacterium]|jgi:SAM-dependent methyltransferase|nr:class I SAM-dependent methyltransferase [Deltaproteobacteria bacterium]MCK5423586.1 class I SAM-dependent methyltransferase [Deltaproteobacteria bacterium]NOQ86172.1 methyltransferase domain-containing protein [Deltaproteobacteria bacterium]
MSEHPDKIMKKVPCIYDKEMYERSYSRDNWNDGRRLLARCIRKGKPGLILDIGCGLGFFVECCYKFGIPCIGLEGSEYAVQTAKKREPNFDVRQHDLADPFPFEDESFSTVMCNEVIEHLPKEVAENALRESYRVLSEGGIIIVYSPSIYNPKQAKEPTHINLHSPKSLKRELKKAGFKKVRNFNKSLKFELGLLNPLNQMIRALFTLLPFSFLSASANCIATKTKEEC